MTNRVSAARLLAYDVLRDVDERNAYANLALQARLNKADLSGRDAAFATELVSQTLRLQGKYDAIITVAAGRDVADIDPRTLRVLRLGAHQLLSMRVGQHAALYESVEMQRLVANKKAAGFVNAVLRKISACSLGEWEARLAKLQSANSLEESLAVLHSHPVWVVRALRDALTVDKRAQELAELLAADNAAPKVQLVLLPQRDKTIQELKNTALAALPTQLQPSELSPLGLELTGMQPANAIAKLAQHGVIARVQDQGSQVAALLLAQAREVKTPEKWLDLCAGPGGKAALLAAFATVSDVPVTLRANEVAAHRAKLVQQAISEAFAGQQQDAARVATVVNFDGTDSAAFNGQLYDRILVDAPCSGLGALRRRPEARWRKQPEDIPQLVRLQEKLLAQAVLHLQPGGLLAYVTCSPHIAETRAFIARLQRKHLELRLLDTRDLLQKVIGKWADQLPTGDHAKLAADNVNRGSGVQLWPHAHNSDAMFIALFTKDL